MYNAHQTARYTKNKPTLSGLLYYVLHSSKHHTLEDYYTQLQLLKVSSQITDSVPDKPPG